MMPLIRPGRPEDLTEIRAIQATSPEASQWDPSDYLHYDLRVLVEEGRVIAFSAFAADGAR